MNEKERTILILKSLIANYPILHEEKLELQKPILLVVEEGQMKYAIHLLSDNRTYFINEYSGARYIEEAFTNSNSSCIIYPFSHSRKGIDFLTFLATCFKAGYISEAKIGAALIVISEDIPHGYDMRELFTVYLDGNLESIHLEEMLEVPLDEQIPVVLDKINSTFSHIQKLDEKPILSAACFLYPSLKERGQMDEFEKILYTAGDLVKKNEEALDTDDLGETFLNILFEWQRKREFHDVYRLPELGGESIMKIHRVVLFNEDFIFMKESFFKVISTPLLWYFPVGVLKSKLADANILYPENTSTYTVKMGYFDQAGIYRRERMLRFNRGRLKKAGELDFIDICCCVERGEEYEN